MHSHHEECLIVLGQSDRLQRTELVRQAGATGSSKPKGIAC